MNIFQKFTLRALKKNRVRTLVTIIGIIISMAMFTAVVESVYSAVQFLIRNEEAASGAFHGYYNDMTAGEADMLAEQKGIDKTSKLRTVGWSMIRRDDTYKPYILICAADENIDELISVRMLDGRMPQNENEIALPVHLLSAYSDGVKIGDTLTLPVGRRVSEDGDTLGANDYLLYKVKTDDTSSSSDGSKESDGSNGTDESGKITDVSDYRIQWEESIADTKDINYTVVGIFERLDRTIEYYDSPGYTALTYDGGASGGADTDAYADSYRVFFTVDDPRSFGKYVAAHPQNCDLHRHGDLLNYYGSFANSSISQVATGMVTVLFLLIFFGSVSLIYNSFSISVGERTRQFGMLKSVGATGRQIRGSVIFEVLVLCGVGIPLGMIAGCAGIGVTFWCLKDQFGFLATSATAADGLVEMHLAITPAGLLLAALVCLFTALVSAWIPARRAMKLSPVEAIRQSADVKLRRRDVRSSPITKLLFGFEGMMAAKNFSRNRKRYRSTVISIFLSVTLFVSASSFCAYLTDAAGTYSTNEGIDLGYYHWKTADSVDDTPTADEMYEKLCAVEGVRQSTKYKFSMFDFKLSRADADPQLIKNAAIFNAEEVGDDAFFMSGYVVFLDDDSFREFCTQNKLNADAYYDSEAPQAILCGDLKVKNYENGASHIYKTSVVKSASLPLTVNVKSYRTIDGYSLIETREDDSGKETYYYYDIAYVKEVQESGEGYDRSKAIALSEDEAFVDIPVRVAAATEARPMVADIAGEMCFVYPLSMHDALYHDVFNINTITSQRTNFAFAVDDYKAAAEDMRRILISSGINESYLYNYSAELESERMLVRVINVFAWGFIVLISMIAMVNMFNTISTNILLRRREFAMLRSVGMTSRGLKKMMNYECIKYGAKGLILGLPTALAITFVIYNINQTAYSAEFYVPWYSIVIAIASVFLVVFATMLYTMRTIRDDNTIDALKNENL